MKSSAEGYPRDTEFWGRVLNQGPASEAKELLRLRKTGRLFEIQIAAGNPTSTGRFKDHSLGGCTGHWFPQSCRTARSQ
jgi:hypothetical protein